MLGGGGGSLGAGAVRVVGAGSVCGVGAGGGAGWRGAVGGRCARRSRSLSVVPLGALAVGLRVCRFFSCEGRIGDDSAALAALPNSRVCFNDVPQMQRRCRWVGGGHCVAAALPAAFERLLAVGELPFPKGYPASCQPPAWQRQATPPAGAAKLLG